MILLVASTEQLSRYKKLYFVTISLPIYHLWSGNKQREVLPWTTQFFREWAQFHYKIRGRDFKKFETDFVLSAMNKDLKTPTKSVVMQNLT